MRTIRVITVLLFLASLSLTLLSGYSSRVLEDHTPPVLSSSQEELAVSVTDPQEALLSGLTARDGVDGDLTEDILVEHISGLTGPNSVNVTYAVFDKAENVAKLTRKVTYMDYESPRFSLTAPLVYRVGAKIMLSDRLTVTDCLQGDISAGIRLGTQGLSNTAAGTYQITVQVTNDLGDTAILPLTVQVVPNGVNVPQVLLSQYIVYKKAGETLLPNQYITRVVDPAAEGQAIATKAVTMDRSRVDMNTPGVYEVYYRYTGKEATGLTILTVVVE